jgi:hypothetical protein
MATAAKAMPVDAEDFKINAYVRAVMNRAKFSSQDALKMILKDAAKDSRIRVALLKLGAEQVIRDYFHQGRRSKETLKASILMDSAEHEEREKAKLQRRFFWDSYTLFGHMELKSATRPDIRDSIKNRQDQIVGNQRCVKFEQAIASRMKGDRTTVEKCFKIATIIEMAKANNVI